MRLIWPHVRQARWTTLAVGVILGLLGAIAVVVVARLVTVENEQRYEEAGRRPFVPD